jgi:branched-chain amino acid transport system substrate-binding protein
VAALDPATLTPRDQRLLPGGGETARDNPVVVYAGGAVYVSGPEDLLRKIDPVSLRVRGTVRLGGPVLGLAWGLGSIWATVGGRPLDRIDPKSLRVTQRIQLPSPEPAPVTVGAGSVWVADNLAGLVWRIDPGPPPQTHTISAGLAAAGIAFGAGAIWIANPIEGRVVRIDAASEQVRSFDVGNAPVAVAVNRSGVWAAVTNGGGRSIAATPELGGLKTLPTGTCRAPVYGGSGNPDFLIAADLPLQRLDAPSTLAMAQAIELVLRREAFRAGRYRVALQVCDDATGPAASATEEKCTANAKRYVATPSVVAVLGPYNSGCAISQIPIANRADPGPLPIVSPTASYVGLTRKGPGVAPNHPGALYPTGKRNFVRVYPPDDIQAAADALLAKRLGIPSVYVFLDNPDDSYSSGLAYSFALSAKHFGIRVGAPDSPAARAFASRARDLRRTGVDAVFVAGYPDSPRTARFIKTARNELGGDLVVLAPDTFLPAAEVVRELGPSFVDAYVSGAQVTDPAHQLPPQGQQFTKALAATQRTGSVNVYAPYAALATEALLAAIARSDGTRASVVRELFHVRLAHSIFGPLSFDSVGDPSTNLVPIFRAPKVPPNGPVPPERVFKLIHVPARLVR